MYSYLAITVNRRNNRILSIVLLMTEDRKIKKKLEKLNLNFLYCNEIALLFYRNYIEILFNFIYKNINKNYKYNENYVKIYFYYKNIFFLSFIKMR